MNTGQTRKMGCLITDFRTAGRGKFKFGGQVGVTDYSTAHPGSDPNYLGDADSSTRFPGVSSYLLDDAHGRTYSSTNDVIAFAGDTLRRYYRG
jgi:hypothetical protein